MHNLSMALKNLKNNYSFYALYLLSVSFVITIFFAFASFSMNTVMLAKISSDGRVETMCNTISVFLMAFVVFYMSYSNRFFLRRRTKELGIYALGDCLWHHKITGPDGRSFGNILFQSECHLENRLLYFCCCHSISPVQQQIPFQAYHNQGFP